MAILIHHHAALEAAGRKTRGRDPLPRSTGPRAVLAALTALLMLTCLDSPRAQAQELTAEYQIKAAFLYNFAKFVEWPTETFPTTSTPFTICALGNDPFGASLDAIAGKTVKDRTLIVKRIRSITAVNGCQILYVSPNELPQATDLLRSLQKVPVLTVCDMDGCAETGLMLNMRMADTRVQLDINLDAVHHTTLKVSSQLLKLTRIVKGQP